MSQRTTRGGGPRGRACGSAAARGRRACAALSRMRARQVDARPRGSGAKRRVGTGRAPSVHARDGRAGARASSSALISSKSRGAEHLVGPRRSASPRPRRARSRAARRGCCSARNASATRREADRAASACWRVRQEERHRRVDAERIAPEEPERLVEERRGPRGGGPGRRAAHAVELARCGRRRPTATARERVEAAGGPDREPGAAEQPDEVHHVVGEARHCPRSLSRGAPASACSRIARAGPAPTLAMSSWYLSSDAERRRRPSRGRARRGRARPARGPVDGLGDAGQLEQVGRAQLLHEARRSARPSRAGTSGARAREDRELARRRRGSRSSGTGSGA